VRQDAVELLEGGGVTPENGTLPASRATPPNGGHLAVTAYSLPHCARHSQAAPLFGVSLGTWGIPVLSGAMLGVIRQQCRCFRL